MDTSTKCLAGGRGGMVPEVGELVVVVERTLDEETDLKPDSPGGEIGAG